MPGDLAQRLPATSGYPRVSGYARVDRDWYVEPRWVVHLLLDVESVDGEVLDPCCGSGTIPSVCMERGLRASGSDIMDRGFGAVQDLFSLTESVDNIISNPPYRIAEACTRATIQLARHKVALILPLTFWESQRRHSLFHEHPPIRFWACGDRPSMPPGVVSGVRDRYGALVQPEGKGGKAPYGWFVWQRGYRGATSAMRLPPRRRLFARPKSGCGDA
jgi:hypothetical protein